VECVNKIVFDNKMLSSASRCSKVWNYLTKGNYFW